MKGARSFWNAIVAALLSVGLIAGALSISLVEYAPEANPTATQNLIPSPEPFTATLTPTTPREPTTALESPTPSITATSTETPTPIASCHPPAGWINQITVQAGDSLDTLAFEYRISKDELGSANCLVSGSLIIGSKLFIPPAPTNALVAACNPGAVGWTRSYIVQSGDSLFRIGYNYYTSLDLMRKINCRVNDTIYPGERLWVPNVATRTPTPTLIPAATFTAIPNTWTPTQTLIPTATITAIPNTWTPTQTEIPTFTFTATLIP